METARLRRTAANVVVFSLIIGSLISGTSVAAEGDCPAGSQWSPGQVQGTGSGDDVVLSAQKSKGRCKPVPGAVPARKNERGKSPKKLPAFIVERMLVSACVTGRPDESGNAPENVDMCSLASDSCNEIDTPPDERRWYFRAWERRRTGPPTYALVGEWELAGFQCYRPGEEPADTVRRDPVRVLSWVDVYNAIRNEPAAKKRVTVQPATRTLVNLDTIVYTDGRNWTKNDLRLLGFSVDVKATPTAYRWSFGDGATVSTATAGRPYPAKDVTHKYVRRSDRVAIAVATTYRASFRVDGGAWQAIEQPLTVTGPATSVAVREAVPVLVDPPRS